MAQGVAKKEPKASCTSAPGHVLWKLLQPFVGIVLWGVEGNVGEGFAPTEKAV
jgi:hypothetical protein